MKTSHYFLDDSPLQIVLIDENISDGRLFFNKALATTWFDYDLNILDHLDEAAVFLKTDGTNQRPLDLLLISNQSWSAGGENFVQQIRLIPAFAKLPVYCIISCNKKARHPAPDCWNQNWRIDTNCNEDARRTTTPYSAYFAPDHPAHINGVICANNIGTELPQIVDKLTSYWFAPQAG